MTSEEVSMNQHQRASPGEVVANATEGVIEAVGEVAIEAGSHVEPPALEALVESVAEMVAEAAAAALSGLG